MISTDLLTGPRLKVKRANSHIDELRLRTNPLSSDWYTLSVNKVRAHAIEAQPSRFELTYRPKEPIPELLAIIVGDAIHNLRSALDHLAGGIIRTLCDPPKDLRPHFPMHPNWEHLKTDRSLAAIEQALPGSKKTLLEEIRPANGVNERLWGFNDLSNLDKHNLIIPSIAVTQIIGSFRTGTSTFTNCGGGSDATKPSVLISSNAPIIVDKDFQTTVDVRFGEGKHPFKNEAVISTLFQIRDIVSETLNAFERLIVAKP